MWHDCGEECKMLHALIPLKIYSIIARSRLLPKNDEDCIMNTKLRLNTTGPSMQQQHNWTEPLDIYIIAECTGENLRIQTRKDENITLEIPNNDGIVMEHWKIVFEKGSGMMGSASTVEFDKNASILVRSIFSLTRTLPAYATIRAFSHSDKLRMFIKTSMFESNFVSLEKSIISATSGSFEASSFIQLAPLATPHGYFHTTVQYRRKCEFVEPSLPIKSSSSLAIPDPSLFENVELEAYSLPRSLEASLPRSISRSISMQVVTSPLAITNFDSSGDSVLIPSSGGSNISRRASSPAAIIPNAPTHSKSGSSLAEDSFLAQLIREYDRPISIPSFVITVPPLEEIKDRLEHIKQKLQMTDRTLEARSKKLLFFSPVIEHQDDDVNNNNNNNSFFSNQDIHEKATGKDVVEEEELGENRKKEAEEEQQPIMFDFNDKS